MHTATEPRPNGDRRPGREAILITLFGVVIAMDGSDRFFLFVTLLIFALILVGVLLSLL